jgi:integrase
LEKSVPELDAPTEIFRTVALTRRPNVELRTREHLTPGEVEALIDAAKANRRGHRDATMILIAFRHGLRDAEVCDLRWDQVDFDGAVLHVRRVKNGTPSTHPLQGDELRALRRLQRGEPAVALRVRQRAWHAVHDRRLCADDRARGRRRRPRIEGASSYASPCLAAMRWPIRGTTPGRYRDGWGTARSRAQRSIRPWRRTGSGIFGGSKIAKALGIGRASVYLTLVRPEAASFPESGGGGEAF